MLDLFLQASYDQTKEAAATQREIDLMRKLPEELLCKIAMGIEVPPEAWGGHLETVGEIDTLADAVNGSGAAGLMLWSIQKPGPAQEFATEICSKLGLGNCAAPLL